MKNNIDENLDFCSCDDYDHLINLTPGDQLNHIVTIEQREDFTRVNTCSSKNDLNFRTLISDPTIIPISSLSSEAKAVLAQQSHFVPECMERDISGEYHFKGYGGWDKEFYLENDVTCPICGETPEKYDDGKLWHHSNEGIYSCNISRILPYWVRGRSETAYRKKFDITKYKPTDGDEYRYTPIENSLPILRDSDAFLSKKVNRLNNKIDNLTEEYEQKLSDKESTIEELKQEKREVIRSHKESDTELFETKAVIDFDNMADKKLIEKMESLVEETIGDSYVYVIVIESDNEPYYYVGKSNNPVHRLKTHMKNKKVIDVERVEGCESSSAALDRERSLFAEIILEKNTANVLGGR